MRSSVAPGDDAAPASSGCELAKISSSATEDGTEIRRLLGERPSSNSSSTSSFIGDWEINDDSNSMGSGSASPPTGNGDVEFPREMGELTSTMS
jgi:hypothetical protein